MSDEIFKAFASGFREGEKHKTPSETTLEYIQELAKVSLDHIKQDKEVMNRIIGAIEKNTKVQEKILSVQKKNLFWSRYPAIFLFCFLVLVVIGTTLD